MGVIVWTPPTSTKGGTIPFARFYRCRCPDPKCGLSEEDAYTAASQVVGKTVAEAAKAMAKLGIKPHPHTGNGS